MVDLPSSKALLSYARMGPLYEPFQRSEFEEPENMALDHLDAQINWELEQFRRGGVLYTPGPAIDFMVQSTGQLLHRSLSQEPATDCALRIIAINDIYQLPNMARLKTCVDFHRTPNTIVTCAGDFLAPSLLSAIDKGHSMVDIMNRVGVDYVCLGNHEANVPFSDFLKRYNESTFTWINTNMPDVNLRGSPPMPDHVIVEVKGPAVTRKVGLLGLNLNNMNFFPKGAFDGAPILDPLETAAKYAEMLADKVDCIVALTHLCMEEDRNLARKGLGFPIALGGHDHDLYHEIVEGQHILKLGCDAKLFGIVDLVWSNGETMPVVNVQIHDCNSYPPDPELWYRIEDYHSLAAKLQDTQLSLFPIATPMSSVEMRSQPTSIGTFLCSAAREALHADCCVIRSGYLRGEKDYPLEQTFFSYADLVLECPLEFPVTVVTMPGQVLAEVVQFARTERVGDGDFLQFDNQMKYEDEALTQVGGQPIDLEREYDVLLPYRALFEEPGLIPLVAWAKENTDRYPPAEEAALLFHLVLVEYWSSALWLQLAKFHELDQDGSGRISAPELRVGLLKLFPEGALAEIIFDNVMACADVNGDGEISLDELLKVTVKCADWTSADIDGDGLIKESEFAAFLEELAGVKLSQEETHKLFVQLDVDVSEALTRKEIRSWVSKQRSRNLGILGKGDATLLLC